MTARHENRKAMEMCQRCRDRKARFQHHGHVRADRDLTLCFECYRSERERQRAHTLPAVELPMLRTLPVRSPLSDGEIDHRLRMLEHLKGSR